MSDRVRYYLESSVKEIQDLKSRGIFEQNELSKIMKRRTEYEHRLLSRKVRPEDFLAYAKYEMQVDKLRQLRIKRLKLGGKKGVSDYSVSRRINFTLERGTKRFPAELKIFMALIEYAHQKQSFNVVKATLTKMLKLHPTNPNVWVYVAKYQVEQNASVPEARAVLQRGLRINQQSMFLWLEYMKLELIYVAKIMARRKLLGLEYARKEELEENQKVDLDKDEIMLNLPDINIDVLGDAESNPALRGDVALAVFDAGLEVLNQQEFALKSIELFSEFNSLNRYYLCSHVLNKIDFNVPLETIYVTLPIRFTQVDDVEFPDKLAQVFTLYKQSSKSIELKESLRNELAERVLEIDNVDENLKKAVDVFMGQM